jgi:class 3 adenylate cyclase
MCNTIERAQQFKSQASHARDGISVIFDIAGFSRFLNQPDVHSYIPKYLNLINKCVEVSLFGGIEPWRGKEGQDLSPLGVLPIHRKFLGDGALYVWAPKESAVLTESFIILLANRLWNVQKGFRQITGLCSEFIPVTELPTGIRFGVTRGTIYELAFEKSGDREYVGVCINLASRLQKYCAGLNFIASARLNMPSSILQKHNYMKVVATNIKGFPKEIVIVDRSEYGKLDPKVRQDLFITL